VALLNAAKTANDTPESQKNMSTLSERVADRILEVVGAARRLPGGAGLRLEEDTGDDLDSIAERELMKAAKMIEDAAKRLLEARPRRVKAPGEQLNEEDINSAILDAARAITDATGSLVKAATVAQRERIAKSRDPTKKHFYRKDPAWANGLISAAQAVGGTTQDLVSSANGFVKKESDCDEDILIAAAKQVAASTARLMAASRAKSDPFSDSHKNLAAASKAVASATQALVDAAKMAGRSLNETEEVEVRIIFAHLTSSSHLATMTHSSFLSSSSLWTTSAQYRRARSSSSARQRCCVSRRSWRKHAWPTPASTRTPIPASLLARPPPRVRALLLPQGPLPPPPLNSALTSLRPGSLTRAVRPSSSRSPLLSDDGDDN